MKKIVQDKNNKISYRIRSSNGAKRLRIAVYYNGDVLVTKPRRVSYGFTENVVNNKLGWILDKLKFFKINYPKASHRYSKAEYLKNRDKATEFILNNVLDLNKNYNFKVGKITIKNHKTLWGSRSKKGNLNFNYRIVNLPSHLAHYIIVHELCHLKEFNHSRKFWSLVERTIHDYKKIRTELKMIKIY